ncbi:unnamed protein product [Caenorhabditis angaria]|uniref:Uncharacterized protein n=1 Tax=Caenorhabditis angaria TaxID=860376 RepID=A0A9P1MZJ6_9PELO|nr:unnamed protein product [Caenorhabditis angaria]
MGKKESSQCPEIPIECYKPQIYIPAIPKKKVAVPIPLRCTIPPKPPTSPIKNHTRSKYYNYYKPRPWPNIFRKPRCYAYGKTVHVLHGVKYADLFKSYKGVPGLHKTYGENHEKLSMEKPELRNRLMKIANFQDPPKLQSSCPNEIPEFLRPLENPIEFPDSPEFHGPVKLDWTKEPEDILNSDISKVSATFDGVRKDVPEFVPCHNCNQTMKICYRRASYRGDMRVYPAYRCLKKGCQTFRSIAKMFEKPEINQKSSQDMYLLMDSPKVI